MPLTSFIAIFGSPWLALFNECYIASSLWMVQMSSGPRVKEIHNERMQINLLVYQICQKVDERDWPEAHQSQYGAS